MLRGDENERDFSDFYNVWREPIRRGLVLAIGDLLTADEATRLPLDFESLTQQLANSQSYRVVFNCYQGELQDAVAVRIPDPNL